VSWCCNDGVVQAGGDDGSGDGYHTELLAMLL
jgi:hypothetical protein